MKDLGAIAAIVYMILSTVALPYIFWSLEKFNVAMNVWFIGLIGFFFLIPFFHRIDFVNS